MFAIVTLARSFFTAYAKKWEADFWETMAITVASFFIVLVLAGATIGLVFKGLDIVGLRRIPENAYTPCVESYHHDVASVECAANQRVDTPRTSVVICRCPTPATTTPAAPGSASAP